MHNPQQLISEIISGKYDERLCDVYGTDERAQREKKRLTGAIAEFTALFGTDNDIEIYSAPGRSEIGGNHTDHQHGHVLAAAISDDAIAVVSKTDDDVIKLLSKGYDMITVSLSSLEKDPSAEGTTEALIRGVAAGADRRGFITGGFNAYVTSDVLSGSGLSSSAAFETLLGSIFSGLYNDMKITDEQIAIIGQYAENEYFGKPCGLMDQMACSVGSLCHIDFADPAKPVIEKLELDLKKAGYSLCITDTKGSHADLTADYAAIPAEMKSVATLYGKEVLSQTDEAAIIKDISSIREKCTDRAFLRAVFFHEENKRVLRLSQAIKESDIPCFLDTVKESGNWSFKYLQNVFPVHDDSRNVAIALMLSEIFLKGNGVSRVHGGGFAGTIQAFVKNEAAQDYCEKMDECFGPGSCRILSIRKYGGICLL